MKYSWVIDIDIKGFFDNIDHELLMKAVCWHTDKKHILLYCKRWLEAPIQLSDGAVKHPQGKGTPQGGVISPVLANIFLVYYQKFDFLGFSFKPRISKEYGKLVLAFTPAISAKSIARINEVLRKLKIHRWTYFSLSRVGELLKSKIRGWLNYYSKFRKSELRHLFRDLNKRLAKWVSNKYRRFRRRHWYFAYKYLQCIAKSYPYMFEHWRAGFMP